MKGVFWAMVLLALAASGAWAEAGEFARADSSNLAGGVFIAHYPAALVYSTDEPPEGWCQKFLDENGITGAEQQVNRIDVPDVGVIWFVLAAWGEPKKFCGVEFGLGSYDLDGFAISKYGACGTGFTPLEIAGSDPAWPQPGSGVSVAAPTGASWRGNYVPFYYFAGYAYAPGTVIPLTANMSTGFGGMCNCDTPPSCPTATCFGAMGILQAGTFCAPEIDPDGACCFGGGVCQIMSMDECDAAGGNWDGGAVCADPNPCPVTWACCTHDEGTGVETCQMLTQGDCTAQAGIWHLDQTCGEGGFTCPLIRACCVDQFCMLTTEQACTGTYQGTWRSGFFSCTTPANPCLYVRACCLSQVDCQLLTESECGAVGGEWRVNYDACLPDDSCPWDTPAERTSWGAIKAIYR